MSLSIRTGILICSAVALLSADTLTLRNGETVQGTYLGGTTRQIRMDLNGTIRNYDIGQVQSVIFSDQNYLPPRRLHSGRNRIPRRQPRIHLRLRISRLLPIGIRLLEWRQVPQDSRFPSIRR